MHRQTERQTDMHVYTHTTHVLHTGIQIYIHRDEEACIQGRKKKREAGVVVAAQTCRGGGEQLCVCVCMCVGARDIYRRRLGRGEDLWGGGEQGDADYLSVRQ